MVEEPKNKENYRYLKKVPEKLSKFNGEEQEIAINKEVVISGKSLQGKYVLLSLQETRGDKITHAVYVKGNVAGQFKLGTLHNFKLTPVKKV